MSKGYPIKDNEAKAFVFAEFASDSNVIWPVSVGFWFARELIWRQRLICPPRSFPPFGKNKQSFFLETA
jgi:hypothetical protein